MTGIYHGTYHRTFHGIYHGIYPLVMTNIAMENGPLIDDLPIDLPIKIVVFQFAVLNNKRAIDI